LVPKEITVKEFASLLSHEKEDEGLNLAVQQMLAREGVTGLVLFECQQMDSSSFGARKGVLFGPECTYRTLKEICAGRLGDVPSRFMYPVAYVLAEPAGVEKP